MATHSSMLAWRIPWTEEPGRLQSVGSQESETTQRLNHHHKLLELSGFCPPPDFLSSPSLSLSPAQTQIFFIQWVFNSLQSLFILMLKLQRVWPAACLSSWLLCPYDKPLSFLFLHFLLILCHKMLQAHGCPRLESVTPPRTPSSFQKPVTHGY